MFAQPGRKIIFILSLATIALTLLSLLERLFLLPAFFCFALSLFFAWFFRDPERKIGNGIVSPADGVVVEKGKSDAKPFIAIFMNVHDVHVNRVPESGKVLSVKHISGKHNVAYGKRVRENEHAVIEIESAHGRLCIIQIAGIFARRIFTYVKPGQVVKKGEKLGIIFLGSRVELYLPECAEIRVNKGERVKAGETTIGVWKDGVVKENFNC